MKRNHLKERLSNGNCVFGTWAMLGSEGVVDVISQAGVDFVILDAEHGSMSFETLGRMVKSTQISGCQPIIRTSDKNESNILRSLEIGSQAVMVPHVQTAEEAKLVVKASRYAPIGERGLSPYTRVHGYSHDNLSKSLQVANENTLVGVLVEGRIGIKNLEAIASVKGIDLIYLGVYDISQSVGLSGQLNHKDVISMQKKCAAVINNKGLIAGSFARDFDYVKLLYQSGFRFIAYLVDCAVLKYAYEDCLRLFRSLTNG